MDFGPLKLDIQRMAGLRPQKWTLADNYHRDKIALSLAHQYINISVETLEQGTTWTDTESDIVLISIHSIYSARYIWTRYLREYLPWRGSRRRTPRRMAWPLCTPAGSLRRHGASLRCFRKYFYESEIFLQSEYFDVVVMNVVGGPSWQASPPVYHGGGLKKLYDIIYQNTIMPTTASTGKMHQKQTKKYFRTIPHVYVSV